MKENEVLGLLIISNSSWILIANNKRLPQKSLVLATLFLVATAKFLCYKGIRSVNTIVRYHSMVNVIQVESLVTGFFTAL
jgi:hypothetical protein